MRRPIAHLTGAAAVLAVLVAVSVTFAPGTVAPGDLGSPAASRPLESSAPTQSVAETTDAPDAIAPFPHLPDGGGTAQPIDRAPVSDGPLPSMIIVWAGKCPDFKHFPAQQ